MRMLIVPIPEDVPEEEVLRLEQDLRELGWASVIGVEGETIYLEWDKTVTLTTV